MTWQGSLCQDTGNAPGPLCPLRIVSMLLCLISANGTQSAEMWSKLTKVSKNKMLKILRPSKYFFSACVLQYFFKHLQHCKVNMCCYSSMPWCENAAGCHSGSGHRPTDLTIPALGAASIRGLETVWGLGWCEGAFPNCPFTFQEAAGQQLPRPAAASGTSWFSHQMTVPH